MAETIPRLALEQLDPRLRDYLKPTVDRLGYLGEFFQTVGNVPDAAIQFMEYTKAVKAPLSDLENEVIALAVCAALGADYERIQHERLAKRLGASLEWIAAAEDRPGANPMALEAEERLLRTLALAMVARGGRACGEEIDAVVAAHGAGKTVAAMLQITRFVTIAYLCNALQLSLPVKSVFEERSAGGS